MAQDEGKEDATGIDWGGVALVFFYIILVVSIIGGIWAIATSEPDESYDPEYAEEEYYDESRWDDVRPY